MEKQKFLKFLGLCKKSGKLISGDYSVEKAINNKKVLMLILSEDSSKDKDQKFNTLAQDLDIDTIKFCSSSELGAAIGKSLSAIIAITDINQKKKLLELYGENR